MSLPQLPHGRLTPVFPGAELQKDMSDLTDTWGFALLQGPCLRNDRQSYAPIGNGLSLKRHNFQFEM